MSYPKVILTFLALVWVPAVFAEGAATPEASTTPSAPPAAAAPAPGNNHPCAALKAACEAAGFHKGGAKQGKGLWKDCIGKMMHGQTVASVNAKPTDIQACQAKKAAHRQHR